MMIHLTSHQYEFNAVFAGRNWNNGETIGPLKLSETLCSDSLRRISAA